MLFLYLVYDIKGLLWMRMPLKSRKNLELANKIGFDEVDLVDVVDFYTHIKKNVLLRI
jgi:hypothetical protein